MNREQRQQLLQSKYNFVLEQLKQRLQARQSQVLPKSHIGKAGF